MTSTNGAKRIGTIADLKPDSKNANLGTQRGRGLLEKSLRQYGAGRSVLADRDGNLIAGNKTVEIAAEIDLPVRVVQTDGHELVVVQRTDLDLDSSEGRGLAIADNRTGETGLEWNTDALLDLSASGIVDLEEFWKPEELDALLGEWGDEPATDPGAQIDRADELRQKWGVESGQLWSLGDHRLICGDCTDADVVARLMDGEKAALAVVDPPYNVGRNYDGRVDDKLTVEEYDQFCRAWFGVCQGLSEKQIVTPGGNNITAWLRRTDAYHVAPWYKNNTQTNGKVSMFLSWEPVLFFGNKWGRKRHLDLFDYPANFNTKKATANHPCPKPLPLWEEFVENYSALGDIVFDSFNGSGTTLIACERLGRKCRAVEIAPGYVGVALERWAQMTGGEPELLN